MTAHSPHARSCPRSPGQTAAVRGIGLFAGSIRYRGRDADRLPSCPDSSGHDPPLARRRDVGDGHRQLLINAATNSPERELITRQPASPQDALHQLPATPRNCTAIHTTYTERRTMRRIIADRLPCAVTARPALVAILLLPIDHPRSIAAMTETIAAQGFATRRRYLISRNAAGLLHVSLRVVIAELSRGGELRR